MKPNHLAMAVGALTALHTAGTAAGVYKWVDKDGRVIYGDQPPPDKTTQSREINTSGVPLALQERLRRLDRTFTVRRITGNLETAYVCLQLGAAQGYEEPAFVTAVNASDLGTIAPESAVEDSGGDEDGERPRPGRDGNRCPEHDAANTETRWVVYPLRFDPKAVMVYHGAP